MAGHFYKLPPTFIGGRQPYAPQLGVAQSGPVPDDPPPLSRVMLGVALAAWIPAAYALPSAAKIAPLIPAEAVASQPPPNRAHLSIIHSHWTRDPITVISLTSVASVLATPPQIDAPPVKTSTNLNAIVNQWYTPFRPLPSGSQFAPLIQAPVIPDNPPVNDHVRLNLVVTQWRPPAYDLPKPGRMAPFLSPTITPDAPPVSDRVNLNLIVAQWRSLPYALPHAGWFAPTIESPSTGGAHFGGTMGRLGGMMVRG